MLGYIDNYAVQSVLGEGVSAVVYKCLAPDNKEYALKVMKLTSVNRHHVQREV